MAGAGTGNGKATYNAGREQFKFNQLFDENSTSQFSQTFPVQKHTMIIRAWGLEDEDFICVHQAYGEHEGELFEPFYLEKGKVAMLLPCQNVLPLTIEGRYRLTLHGDNAVGRVTVIAHETAIDGVDLSGFTMQAKCCPTATGVDALPNMAGAGAPAAAPDFTAQQGVYVDTANSGNVYVHGQGVWFRINDPIHWMAGGP